MPALIRAPQVTTGIAVDVGTVNANGSGDALALANHVHAMGAGASTAVLNAKRFIFGDQVSGFTASAASSDNSNALTKKIFDASLTKKIAGSTSLSAIMTTASVNKVIIRENTTNDPIENATHDEVFGRLTGTPVALVQTYTWAGTTTVLSSNTSEVVAGDWIKLDSDTQYFEVDSVSANVSVTILNPGGLTIPTGATASSKLKLTLTYLYEDSSNIEQAYTFATTKVVDLLFGESLTLWEAPINALQTGVAFQEIISGSHLHDDRYVQKTTLSAKGSLISATSAGTPTDLPVGNTDGMVLTVDVAQTTGLKWATPSSATWRQENVTTQNITNTDTALTDLLNNAPVGASSVVLHLNGVMQSQGSGKDYTLAGQTITWLANTGTAVDMVSTDELVATYQS